MRFIFHIFLIFFLSGSCLFAQSTQQKKLEAQKKEITQQIQQISQLHSQQIQKRKSVVEQIDDINQKINKRQHLIQVTNQQIFILEQNIKSNTLQINDLKRNLSNIQLQYAQMVSQSYKNKSAKNRIAFVLSSKNFSQAYRRIQYMKQYASYRKQQALEIEQTSKQLEDANLSLMELREEKQNMILENKKEQQQLSSEKKQREVLIQTIKKKEKQYLSLIKKKKQEVATIENEIQKVIQRTIAENNKKQGKSGKNTFTLTPEAKKLASSFEANKGKLIWPVVKGFKSQGFGTYADPVYPDVKHMNNGVTIDTEAHAIARAVFDGEVSAVFAIPGGNLGIQVRHGNYISIYSNLTESFVSKGDKVKTKTPLGKIYTAPSGKTELKFYLYKNNQKLNPELWIYQM